MTVDEKNIIWLDLFEFLSYSKKNKLIEAVGIGNDLRKEFLKNNKINEILSNEEINKMAICLHDEFLNLKLQKYAEDGVQCVTYFSPDYPYLLKEIASPPLCLYCKGNVQLLNTTCVGVVGTRKPTDYGLVVTKQYVKELTDVGVTIVSGMATGIDTIAHKGALENQGSTIAVLAGGFNHIYPASNRAMFNELSKSNLVVTEHNPTVKPETYFFPVRNRIIAGLSKAVLVTEAGEKSGSLHTINYATEFNREIFAVPGKINSPMSKGTNAIIQNLQGCVTLSPQDILNSLNLSKDENKKQNKQLDINTQLILDFISAEKKTLQEIVDHTNMSVKELNSKLIEMEMDGLVVKLANNSYIKA